MHSKTRLLLAIFTSPLSAFEEILRRRLLGTALVMIALAGTMAAAATIIRGLTTGPIQFFTLGKENPICWIGLCFLYAWATMKLLGWLGVRADYEKIVTIMGWSQIALLLSQVMAVALAIATAMHVTNQNLLSVLSAANLVFVIWYVLAIGYGIQTACGVPSSRGILTYVVVAAMAGMVLGVSYNLSRVRGLDASVPGFATAQKIVAADQTPWLIAAVVGLAIGLVNLGRALGWDESKRSRAAVSAGIIGVLALGGYMYAVSSTNYFNTVAAAQRMYQKGNYQESAVRLEKLLPLSTDNQTLLLDLGDVYFLAGKNQQSLSYYQKFLDSFKSAGPGAEVPKAQAYSRIGMVYDLDGKYDQAIRAFKESAKLWSKFKDPWVRMSVTYDRMGDYQKAIESGNHAVKDMDSSATLAWVALAQAFSQTNDTKQAGAAIAMVAGKNSDLAKRIGDKPENWKNAVSKLTAQDLKFPLEKEVSATQVKSDEKKKPAEQKK